MVVVVEGSCACSGSNEACAHQRLSWFQFLFEFQFLKLQLSGFRLFFFKPDPAELVCRGGPRSR